MKTCSMCGTKYRGHVHVCPTWWPPKQRTITETQFFLCEIGIAVLGWCAMLLIIALHGCTTDFAIRGTETPKVRKAADGHYGWGHTAHFHNINHQP